MPSCETKGNTADALPGGHPGPVQYTPHTTWAEHQPNQEKGREGGRKPIVWFTVATVTLSRPFAATCGRWLAFWLAVGQPPVEGLSPSRVGLPCPGRAPSLVQGLRLPRGFALSRQGPVPYPGTAADLGLPCPGRDPLPIGEPRFCRVGMPCPGRDPFLVQELRLLFWVCLVQAGTRSLSGSRT